MGIPQVPAQVRRAPLLALRAVFAGIGRVLLMADRPAAAEAPQPASRFRSLDQTGNVRLLPAQETDPGQEPQPAREQPPACQAPATREPPEAAEPLPAREAFPTEGLVGDGATLAATLSAVADSGAGLPLPNYDELSLASIRARLRGLDVAQLKMLLDYEAANAERAEIIGMFERRIERLEAGA
jgi:hypothetical protein